MLKQIPPALQAKLPPKINVNTENTKMKLYKYRNLTEPMHLSQLRSILKTQKFWCGEVASFNDDKEFAWDLNTETTEHTEELLAKILTKQGNFPLERNLEKSKSSIKNGRSESIFSAMNTQMIKSCRENLGLLCFSTSHNNPFLWERYGDNHRGICIELEIPSSVMDEQLQYVEYQNTKSIHIDQILRAHLGDRTELKNVYTMALATKLENTDDNWQEEKEVRFIAKIKEQLIRIDGSEITRLILGNKIDPALKHRIKRIVNFLNCKWPIEDQI